MPAARGPDCAVDRASGAQNRAVLTYNRCLREWTHNSRLLGGVETSMRRGPRYADLPVHRHSVGWNLCDDVSVAVLGGKYRILFVLFGQLIWA